MKICSKCKASKDESAYYTSRSKATGIVTLMSQCRACMNATAQAYQRGAGHERRIRYSAEWRARNQERVKLMKKAHNAVAAALKAGYLIRPKRCELCEQEHKRIEAAHFDYAQPLKVKWYCASCHRLEDAKLPKSVQLTGLAKLYAEASAQALDQ